MRALIQYDLDEPAAPPPLAPSDTARPPVKKRKRNHRNPHPTRQKTLVQHWDDPGSATTSMIYDEQEAAPSVGSVEGMVDLEEEEEEYDEVVEGSYAEEEVEESRELTYEEIWDDSALIDAWNSAEAEYEAYHGVSKSWKTETVKKSPLWYNKPFTAPKKTNVALPREQEDDGTLEPDTAPLDFDTYIPTHDPSLSMPSDGATLNPPPTATAPFFVPPSSMTMVSRDEAFNNALSAMYWCGYWTAVYQRESLGDVPNAEINENGVDVDEDEDEADLVPAQR